MAGSGNPVAINVTEVKRHEKRNKRFGLWVFAAELTLPFLVLVSVPLGLLINVLKCVIVVFWGTQLSRNAPDTGPAPEWEDDEDEREDDEDDWGIEPQGDWQDYRRRTGIAAWI